MVNINLFNLGSVDFGNLLKEFSAPVPCKKRRKLKKYLSCENKNVHLSSQVHSFENILTNDVTPNKKIFLQLRDFEWLLLLKEKLNEIKFNVSFFGDKSVDCDTEIHIGAPMKNFKTNLNLTKYFENFKWHIENKKDSDGIGKYERVFEQDLKNMNNPEFIEKYVQVKDKGWEGFEIVGKKIFLYESNVKDCAVLIRFKEVRGVNVNVKTIFHLFGIGSMGREAAVRYFVNSYDKLYDEYKDRECFLIAEVKSDREPLKFKNYWRDLRKEL
jgi:hypothetical protein